MEENKVLGIETTKYTKICYILILIASGFGVLSNLLGMFGAVMYGGLFIGLLGLIGLAMAAMGWVIFKDKFSSLDVSHFKFLIILFIAFFIFGMIFAILIMGMGSAGMFIMVLLAILQFSLLLAGFQIWRAGQEATKNNLINGLKNLKSSFKS